MLTHMITMLTMILMKVKKNLWSIVGCATRVAGFFEVAPISLVEGGYKTEVTFL